MKKQTLEQLRGAALSTDFEFEFENVEFNGATYQVRQPSINQRNALVKSCTVTDDNGNIGLDKMEFILMSIYATTYLPGTDTLVFSLTDRDSLEASPTGGVIDLLFEAAFRLSNVELDTRKKPLKTTKKSSSSSKSQKS